ncbi:cellulose biosynthesis cyclic di-GMP-binding regulatory protein BcsB [Shinella curvata]|uniref:Cyclic di-GMP-binding protein n=1 Tax=Shinella curvata TaxID=1817964 RepID=A0ABT8X728_9HYPH|nr:cellulose biosynthesis cyclic di-GMP-binding regulatory protein BcsB [Shinella curvata]MCJ8052492.1 cellulose biosynthesis cyclic di-GMP-binding regulatory protein BcsB [Shinella curvata]MDO6119559.1 cellulose biosynthesis cyclic di-GMP-binding regulatory protein BcsB [Shinella curvata]
MFPPAKAALFGLVFALSASTAFAQQATVPFDMSGERGPTVETKPAASDDGTPAVETKVPEKKAEVPDVAARRYIIPATTLMLEGEAASHSFPVYLTPQQAAAATSINLGYSNAVVVAPEVSGLTVIVNDVTVGETPVQSPEGTKDMRFELPAGLLRPGVNRVTFNAVQRHRTDCTIRSTYDLWTALDPARTYLTVSRDTSGRLLTTDDIAAIGVGPDGRTRFTMIVPEMGQPITTNALMRLSQGLALMAKMPNQTFDVVDTLPVTGGAGELHVMVGTAADLSPLLPGLPSSASVSAVATFVDAPAGDRKIFVVSGPDWPSIEGAVEGMVSPIDRPLGVTREALSVRQRNAAEMPLLSGATTLRLASLGVRTAEFSGRRLRTGFDVGIPSDFFAGAYGEATLLLDAAYSAEVQPGSHVDIYVNGNIASTVPITSRNGGIFRHLPIRVTMRHFRPGPNRIDIETVLMTAADKVCAPGSSASEEPRFALFDTSEFRMPRFARIAQLPNLAALSGTGFPYSRAVDPIALYLDRLDTDTLSSSATFLGKMAVSSGRALQVRPESSALAIGERDALLFGTISQLPPLVLAQTHIEAESASSWGGAGGDAGQGATQDALNEWQSRVRGGSWRGQFSAFEAWLQETFDISLSSLRLLPGEEAPVTPDDASRFLVAQGDSPGRTAVWTVVSAPTGADLRAGMNAVAQDARWQQLDGYITLESKDVEALDTRAVSRTRFVATQPWTFANLRLIAANWLSSNILAYAMIFCVLSILLGIATSGLLRRFGRPV